MCSLKLDEEMFKSPILNKMTASGEKTALVYRGEGYSYRALAAEIIEMSSLLEKNDIKKGEVVALISDYSFKSIALFFALMENKNIIVPMTTAAENEINERLREAYTDKSVRLDDTGFGIDRIEGGCEKHELIAKIQNNGTAGLILFSSGSTGKPKAMVHDLDNLAAMFQDRKARDLRILVFLMFDHIGGLNTLLNAISMGAMLVIPENRDADHVCELIEKNRINILPASPTFLNLIIISGAHQRYDLSSLNMITYGTEPMTETLLGRLKAVFPRVRFLQTFGTSETGIARTSSKSSTSTLLRIEDPNIEFKVVNDELWLKSKTQVLGYLNAGMDSFTQDGWYMTGDLVEQTEDGYLKITGRSKEMINVGGQKVLPGEVENILLEMPQIADCMAYGEKNAITGQIVAVDVVLKDEADKNEIRKEVRKYCAGRMENYKIPAKINIVDNTNFTGRFKKLRIKS